MGKKILTLIGLLTTAFAGYSQTVPPPENLPRENWRVDQTDYRRATVLGADPILYDDHYDVTIAEDDDYLYVQGLFNNPNDSAVKNAWAVAKKIPGGIEFIQGQKVTEELYLHSGLLKLTFVRYYYEYKSNF